MSEEVWNGFPERRKSERRSLDAALVPAAFLVQLAASHAGIGPFAKRNLETPAAAAGFYRRAAGAMAGAAHRAPRLA